MYKKLYLSLLCLILFFGRIEADKLHDKYYSYYDKLSEDDKHELSIIRKNYGNLSFDVKYYAYKRAQSIIFRVFNIDDQAVLRLHCIESLENKQLIDALPSKLRSKIKNRFDMYNSLSDSSKLIMIKFDITHDKTYLNNDVNTFIK
jgi:hypothetical protein